ncbi:hypothetical protein OSTOST_20771 [Ostertagia ostertagi]
MECRQEQAGINQLHFDNDSVFDIAESENFKLFHTGSHLEVYVLEEMFTSGAVQIKKDAEAQVLVIGLGAGFINSYLHHTYPEMQITVVEIDPKMLEVAKKWFGLELDRRHTVTVMDGVDFLKQAVMKGTTEISLVSLPTT